MYEYANEESEKERERETVVNVVNSRTEPWIYIYMRYRQKICTSSSIKMVFRDLRDGCTLYTVVVSYDVYNRNRRALRAETSVVALRVRRCRHLRKNYKRNACVSTYI